MNRILTLIARRSAGPVIGLMVLMSAGGFIAPPRAHAQFIVTDIVQQVLDYTIDTLAWQAANVAIETILKSTVNWINSGFQGSPAFVTDLKTNLRGVGDAVANKFFEELSNQAIATTPFQDKVLDAVRLGYYLRTSPESFYTRYPYTLNQVSANDRAFLAGDFSQGGFNAWFATVMNPQNNPYGAQMLANEALENAVTGATGQRLEELSWNRGFLSWRGDCAVSDASSVVALSGADPCLEYEINTPGSVIMEQLNQQLGAGVNRLISADEINELIGALLNQLASKVLGGDSGGLRGVSRPASGGGGSFLDQATNSARPGTSGSYLSQNFSATIVAQKQQMDRFRAQWEKIRGAAQAAEQKCGTNGNPNPQSVVNRAGAALVKAADAIAALDALQTRIAQVSTQGGDQTLNLVTITDEYNALMGSDRVPTPEEMAEAASGSDDTNPESLYSRMVRLSEPGGCSMSN